ncbi:phosphoribosyltransferase [Patescibacteria group bacterium]|nr:phosphoribosyltransferase [Patescibacteria group bacterium]
MAVQYLPISWDHYHRFAHNLAAALLNSRQHPDEIVAISRGGLTLGHLLSDLLRIPISTITIQSYTDIQSQGELKITHGLQTDIHEKHILLVDDVSDSGKTMKRALSYLSEFQPEKVTTLTMFVKPRSVYRPDYFAKQTTRWILFPYEPTEMIGLIIKQLEGEGKSKSDIQTFLETLHYDSHQIRFVRKYHLKRP